MEENREKLFEESVKKRPAMFIGNDGLTGFLIGLLTNCLELCAADKILFEITIAGDNDFSLEISSEGNVEAFLSAFYAKPGHIIYYFPKVLTYLAERFEIVKKESKTQILFAIDKTVIADTSVDYSKLSEKVLQLALLNRHCEILIKDQRGKYPEQNYYHFPQGIFYLYERAMKDALGKPEFNITFDGSINAYSYQIGLAYRSDWFPEPAVGCFVNNVQISGGSLVDGVMEGLITACRTYVKKNDLKTHKIKRKKFINGLILVCAIRGEEDSYDGNWKHMLENDDVFQDVKKRIYDLVLEFFDADQERAKGFLWRFDTTAMTSAMFS